MRALLTAAAAGLAALALPSAPAEAEHGGGGSGFTPGSPDFRSAPSGPFGDRRDGRHRRSRDTVVVGNWGWNGEWALYNNRSFEPDSFNGWWHDRPDRAYPAWVQRNQGCQRQWWSGDALTC